MLRYWPADFFRIARFKLVGQPVDSKTHRRQFFRGDFNKDFLLRIAERLDLLRSGDGSQNLFEFLGLAAKDGVVRLFILLPGERQNESKGPHVGHLELGIQRVFRQFDGRVVYLVTDPRPDLVHFVDVITQFQGDDGKPYARLGLDQLEFLDFHESPPPAFP